MAPGEIVLSLNGLVDLDAARVPAAGGLELIVIRTADGEHRLFTNRCTHRGRELDYDRRNGRLACCSGKSSFTLEG
jgi:phenylpropionate dioxygenase-like ring-hydroxylating dioxygenase large terminal subunit